MISQQYCVQMARYNYWQNTEMARAMDALTETQRLADSGAFFGSIQRTANHLLWGDLTWLSRFDGGAGPQGGLEDSGASARDFDDWQQQRTILDQRFLNWAKTVQAVDLEGEYQWFSGAMQREIKVAKAACVIQMFNHQTHHRGQIHAMVTRTGHPGWTTDVPFMPDTFTES